MSLVKIDNISAGYGKNIIIENTSLQIESGELICVLGANGSGKSTLIKAIGGILPHDGCVVIEGQNVERLAVKKRAELITYCPQKSGLSLDMSVLDVVLMGFNPRLNLLENPDRDMRKKAAYALESVGLGGKTSDNYMKLSEGQKQLVCLARTLVSDGKLILLDEPENALDFSIRYRVIKLIKQWIGKDDRSGLITLHDTMLALNCCDRVILLKEKGISGIINPREDDLVSMEEKLSGIYGNVKLNVLSSATEKRQLVMTFCE